MENIRTIQEFVEDMVSDGKSLKQILVVTFNSRWRNFRKEVEKEYNKLFVS